MLVPNLELSSKNEVPDRATALRVTALSMARELPAKLVNSQQWADDVRARLKEIGRNPAWLARELSKKLKRKVHPSQVSRMMNIKSHTTFLVGPTCELLGIPAPEQVVEGVPEPDRSDAEPRSAGSGPPLDAAMRAMRTIWEINPRRFREAENEILALALTLSEQERKKQ